MKRVEFTLTMPARGSWDGKWSGERKNFTLTRELDDAQALKLNGRSWSYGWSDGWRASITARVISEGAVQKPSDGFHGYDWMVASIISHDKIYADHERPEAAP
jgi:hypothetical protein